jgi:hypothetical protein
MAAWPVQHVGSSGEDVRTVQYLLEAHGASLVVDGVFGPITKAKVEQFQAAHGLTVDGVVGSATWKALLVHVSLGNAGPAVRAVQSQVAARLGSPAVNGNFDAETDEFVRHFQEDLGLFVDGIVGPATWLAIVTGGLGQNSGEHAAKAVFQAWAHHDPVAARKNATAAAVALLFARTWAASDGWTFAGSEGAAGSVYSTWTRTGGQLVLRSNDNAGTPFFFVEGVTFTP